MKKRLSFVLVFATLLLLAACGKETQAPEDTEHIHHWKPATCETPKTCTGCRATQGDPLSHPIEVGTCSQCNVFRNQALVTDLKKDLNTLIANLKGTNDYLQKVSASTTDIQKLLLAIDVAQPVFLDNELTLKRAIALCGDYKELSSVKVMLETSVSHFPKKAGDSPEEVNAYFTESNICYNNISTALQQLNKIK